MSLGEFELIDRFFRDCGARRADVALGIGDDAALLDCPIDRQLVAAIDTMVLGNHFLAHFPPESIGHRALAVKDSALEQGEGLVESLTSERGLDGHGSGRGRSQGRGGVLEPEVVAADSQGQRG